MIQITSKATINEDLLDYTERRGHLSVGRQDLYRQQARILEKSCALFGCKCSVPRAIVSPYFLLFGVAVKEGISVNGVVKHRNDLKRIFYSRYVRFQIPIPGTQYLGIEFPNLFTNDIHLKKDMLKLLNSDFLFMKIYLHIVENQVINRILISEELGMSDTRLKRYLKDMERLGVISENGKFVEESDTFKCGYYWKRWSHSHF